MPHHRLDRGNTCTLLCTHARILPPIFFVSFSFFFFKHFLCLPLHHHHHHHIYSWDPVAVCVCLFPATCFLFFFFPFPFPFLPGSDILLVQKEKAQKPLFSVGRVLTYHLPPCPLPHLHCTHTLPLLLSQCVCVSSLCALPITANLLDFPH